MLDFIQCISAKYEMFATFWFCWKKFVRNVALKSSVLKQEHDSPNLLEPCEPVIRSLIDAVKFFI